MIKKILRYTLYTILGVFVALLIFPFIFKDKIVRAIENAANDNLNAVVSFSDIDVSFIRSFPDIYISIEDLSIQGKDTFQDIPLLNASNLKFDVNIFSLFSKDEIPSIEYMGFEDGAINILVLPNGMANYDISKIDSTDASKDTLSFEFDVQKYVLKNTDITYTDQSMPMFMTIKNVEHTGHGNFGSNRFDLKTITSGDSLTLRHDGISYLKNVKTSLEAVLDMDLEQEKYVLKDNILRLNELDVSGNGFVQFLESGLHLNLDVKTPLEDIRELLSIVPNVYTKDYDQVKTNGLASLDVKLDGIYDGEKQHYPAFDVGVKVDNGYILYPGSPFPVENLYMDLRTFAKKPDYKDLAIQIPNFKFVINKESVAGKLNINNASGDQNFVGEVKGRLNLANIQKALQITSFDKLAGIVDLDLVFNTLMSYIVENEYTKIKGGGHATGKNIVIKPANKPMITVQEVKSTFSPEKLQVDFVNLKLGSSHIDAKANIKNPLAYFTTQKAMETSVVFSADNINLDEWNQSNVAPQSNAKPEVAFDKNQEAFIKKSGLQMDGKIGKLTSGGLDFSNLVIKADATANLLKIDQFSGNVKNSDFFVTGVVKQAFDYIFSNGILMGNLDVKSKNFDCDVFMPETTASTGQTTSVYTLPERMNIEVTGHFDKLKYTNLQFEKASGKFVLGNQEAFIKGFNTNAFGGNIGLDGHYDTKNMKHPGYSAKLDLSKIKFADAMREFEVFKKVMPIAEYIEGIFNTTLVMKGNFTEGMSLDLSSLDASGFIETMQGKIKAYPPLLELGKKLQIKEIQNFDITNTKNWFDIVQGVIDIKPFQKNIQDIEMDISGKQIFGTGMDILLKMKIPRALLEKNKATAAVNTGLVFLEKEAQKIGLNIQQSKFIHVNVNMLGKLLNPDIKISLVSGSGGSIEDQIGGKIEETGEMLKDTLQKEIDKQKEKARDTIKKVIDKEVEKAKDKIEKESQKAIDSIKQKAKEKMDAKLDSLSKGAISDSLKQKASEVLNKNTDKEIDKIKDKLKDFDPFKKKKD